MADDNGSAAGAILNFPTLDIDEDDASSVATESD